MSYSIAINVQVMAKQARLMAEEAVQKESELQRSRVWGLVSVPDELMGAWLRFPCSAQRMTYCW